MNNSHEKWDLRFLSLAKFISAWSKDPSTKTGAVLVRSDRTILSVGFNGFPRQMSDAPEIYADRDKKYSRVVHCEVNALIAAHQSIEGSTLYTWPFMSCDRCVVQMIQAGVYRFVSVQATADGLSRWGKAFELVRGYMDEAGVYYTEYPQESVQ